MAISLPTIVFVPGAWHSPEYSGAVISILEPLGYKCVTVSMPAVGRIPPVENLDEDIAVVRTAVMEELDAGRDVIIHGHSWAGIPLNSALDGFSKTERQKEGKEGAVLKLTFVWSFVIPENTSLLEAIGNVVPDNWDVREVMKTISKRLRVAADLQDGNLWITDMKHKFYHDLELEQQEYWIARLKPHSANESCPMTPKAQVLRVQCALSHHSH